MRVITTGLVACVCLLSATAYAQSSRAPILSTRDLPAILDAKPVVPEWTFTPGDSYIYSLAHPPAFTLRELFRLGDSPTKAQKAFADKLKRAGFLIGRHKTWGGEGPPYNKYSNVDAVAVFFAFLFRDASGAGRGIRLLRTTLVPVTGSRVLPAKGLGQDSSGAYASGTTGNEQALYLWRRANLAILAFMDCHDGPCEDDPGKAFGVIQPAARAYADEIDARAKHKL